MGYRVHRRGVYLLPNLLTTGALFAGFYAIVASMNAQFEAASLAIFVAMFFDGLDGRVARLTNTQSAFGVQYDSLSDMVSFGVAPALVAFSWALSSMGKLGWAAAFVYVAGAALRLARFNTQAATSDSSFFRGLASPAAAALLASLVWSATDLGFQGDELPARDRGAGDIRYRGRRVADGQQFPLSQFQEVRSAPARSLRDHAAGGARRGRRDGRSAAHTAARGRRVRALRPRTARRAALARTPCRLPEKRVFPRVFALFLQCSASADARSTG